MSMAFLPSLFMAIARFAVTVVLPTPNLPLAMAIVFKNFFSCMNNTL